MSDHANPERSCLSLHSKSLYVQKSSLNLARWFPPNPFDSASQLLLLLYSDYTEGLGSEAIQVSLYILVVKRVKLTSQPL